MSKYINTKDLELEVSHYLQCEKESKAITLEELKEITHRLPAALPSADVAEVVKCKDCVYGIENGEWCGQKVYLCSAMTNPNEFYGGFYCASGERKEDLTDKINELIGEGFVI